MKNKTTCPVCGGSGFDDTDENVCLNCDGFGEIENDLMDSDPNDIFPDDTWYEKNDEEDDNAI